jgi:hypothetical protein
MGFGYYDGDQNDGQEGQYDPNAAQQQSPPQAPGWFREYMKKAADDKKALEAQVQALQQVNARNAVADALESKGYDRAAATLYSGDPAKVDEWLATTGSLLAKQPGVTDAAGAGQGAGTPASTVPPDGQAQLQALQAAGTQGVAPPAGTEAEQVALMNTFTSAEQLTEFLASNGNQQAMYWNG